MGGYRYSYNAIGFGGEDVARSADRLARLGYDAMEIEGEPDKYDPKDLRKAAADSGLGISSVCPNFTSNRDLFHTDPDPRAQATQPPVALVHGRWTQERRQENGVPGLR